MSAISQSKAHDAPRLIGKRVPGIAAMVDDIVVAIEDPVGEPVVAHELPDVFGWVELGAFWRARQDCDVCRHGRMVAADAFSHALTNPLLSPHVYHEGTFTAAGMTEIEKTTTLADLLARNDTVPAGTRISMEAEEFRSVA
jgi:hypothetical protein